MAYSLQHIFYIIAVACVLHCRPVLNCPAGLPWSDPCGGSNSIGGQGGLTVITTLSEALADFVISATESESYARILREKYTDTSSSYVRISNSLAFFLTNNHCDPVPYVRNNFNNVTDALQSDFNDIATIAIFMENIHQNERTSGTNIKFTHEMDDLEVSLYTSLCKLNMAAEIAGHSLNTCIGREVMGASFRDIQNVSFRYMRDFIVFRDSEKYLKISQSGYGQF